MKVLCILTILVVVSVVSDALPGVYRRRHGYHHSSALWSDRRRVPATLSGMKCAWEINKALTENPHRRGRGRYFRYPHVIWNCQNGIATRVQSCIRTVCEVDPKNPSQRVCSPPKPLNTTGGYQMPKSGPALPTQSGPALPTQSGPALPTQSGPALPTPKNSTKDTPDYDVALDSNSPVMNSPPPNDDDGDDDDANGGNANMTTTATTANMMTTATANMMTTATANMTTEATTAMPAA